MAPSKEICGASGDAPVRSAGGDGTVGHLYNGWSFSGRVCGVHRNLSV